MVLRLAWGGPYAEPHRQGEVRDKWLEGTTMKIDFRAIAILIFLLLMCQSVSAATASGSSALALASIVAAHSPVLSTGDTLLIRRLFNGHFHRLRGDTNVISIEANAIVCRYRQCRYHLAFVQADLRWQDHQLDWGRRI